MKKYLALLMVFALFTIKMQGQCTTATTVPYFEGFNSVVANNQLPICWAASNMSNTCLTFTNTNATANPRAAFFNSPAGTSYFYSPSILLNSGVAYSVSLFHVTDNTGSTNWTDLSILLGSSQSTTGLVSIVSSGGPANSSFNASLSGTFSVASSGVYYVAISGTGNTSGSSPYLYWDDLSITAPCSVPPNSPTITVGVPGGMGSMSCSGKVYTFIASGASTYTWSTGSNGPSISYTVASSAFITVSGTNTLTSCTSSANVILNTTPSPTVTVTSPTFEICAGQSLTLTAHGAPAYNWHNISIPPATTAIISPTLTTTYTLTGMSFNGCSHSIFTTVTVNPLPTLTLSSTPNAICLGETLGITVTGANSYQWASSTGTLSAGNSLTVSPTINTVYSVTGTNAQGCAKTETLAIAVEICTDIPLSVDGTTWIHVYPNPAKTSLNIELMTGDWSGWVITNVGGQVVAKNDRQISRSTGEIPIDHLQVGTYYLQLFNNTKLIGVHKIIKE